MKRSKEKEVEFVPRTRKPRGKLEILCKFFLAILVTWAIAVFTVYFLDLPSQGGSDEFCDSFYIPPDDASDTGKGLSRR